MRGVEEWVRRLQKELAELRGKYSQEHQAVRSTLKTLKKKLEEHISLPQDTHKHDLAPLWHSDKKSNHVFGIDCSKPVEDKVFNTNNFAEFLKQRIKVNGKLGKLGDNIQVSNDERKVKV